jgi:hypothetical protein
MFYNKRLCVFVLKLDIERFYNRSKHIHQNRILIRVKTNGVIEKNKEIRRNKDVRI